MTNPLDSTDLASLVQADWHEEFGDIDYANEIRESVLEPQINNWHWTDAGVVGVGGGGSSAGAGDVVGAGGGILNFGVGISEDVVGAGDPTP